MPSSRLKPGAFEARLMRLLRDCRARRKRTRSRAECRSGIPSRRASCSAWRRTSSPRRSMASVRRGGAPVLEVRTRARGAASSRRLVVVTRKTPLELLLERHGTYGQAKFYLESRGQSIGWAEEVHERFCAGLALVQAAVPP